MDELSFTISRSLTLCTSELIKRADYTRIIEHQQNTVVEEILLEPLMTLIVASVSSNVHMYPYLLEAHIRIGLRNLHSHRGCGRCTTTVGDSHNSTDRFIAFEMLDRELSHLSTGLISNSESRRPPPTFSSFRTAVQLLAAAAKVTTRSLQSFCSLEMITSRALLLPVVLAIAPKMVDLGYFEHIFVTHVLFCIVLTNRNDCLAVWVLLKYRLVNDYIYIYIKCFLKEVCIVIACTQLT